MPVKASSYQLNICCKKHPEYRGIRKSSCSSCLVIFVLLHQNDDTPEESLGGLNPYAYLLGEVNLETALEGIVVKSELSPSRLLLTKKNQATALVTR